MKIIYYPKYKHILGYMYLYVDCKLATLIYFPPADPFASRLVDGSASGHEHTYVVCRHIKVKLKLETFMFYLKPIYSLSFTQGDPFDLYFNNK